MLLGRVNTLKFKGNFKFVLLFNLWLIVCLKVGNNHNYSTKQTLEGATKNNTKTKQKPYRREWSKNNK